MTKNANCPKDQYMVVKNASYRGLSPIKTCGLSDDYSCEVDVTCLVKKQCDGQHECNITVNDTLFSGDRCSRFTMYLYFEYQCINTATSFNGPCGTYDTVKAMLASFNQWHPIITTVNQLAFLTMTNIRHFWVAFNQSLTNADN